MQFLADEGVDVLGRCRLSEFLQGPERGPFGGSGRQLGRVRGAIADPELEVGNYFRGERLTGRHLELLVGIADRANDQALIGITRLDDSLDAFRGVKRQSGGRRRRR